MRRPNEVDKRGKDGGEEKEREGESIKKNYKQAGRWPVEPLLSKRLSCLWICQGTVWREAIIHLPFASDRNTAPYLNTECHWSRTASLIPLSCMHSTLQPLENLGSTEQEKEKLSITSISSGRASVERRLIGSFWLEKWIPENLFPQTLVTDELSISCLQSEGTMPWQCMIELIMVCPTGALCVLGLNFKVSGCAIRVESTVCLTPTL